MSPKNIDVPTMGRRLPENYSSRRVNSQTAPESQENHVQSSNGRGKFVGNWFLLVLAIFALYYSVVHFTNFSFFSLAKTEWQAVFLDDGQVYFGQVQNERLNPLVLKKIYYLQTAQPLQQLEPGQKPPIDSLAELSLVKLGNELHGSLDEMRINRDHVLFIEDLKEDSRVVEAIERFELEK